MRVNNNNKNNNNRPNKGTKFSKQCKMDNINYFFTFFFFQDLLNIESDSTFEEHFYKFRVKVRDLEQRRVEPLKRAYDGVHSLPALLHVLELYQGISRREYIKVGGREGLRSRYDTCIPRS